LQAAKKEEAKETRPGRLPSRRAPKRKAAKASDDVEEDLALLDAYLLDEFGSESESSDEDGAVMSVNYYRNDDSPAVKKVKKGKVEVEAEAQGGHRRPLVQRANYR